jgi:glycosyltransferase involved in cell wall biosynthesis
MTRIVYLNKVKLDSNLPAVNFSVGNAYGLAQAGAESYLLVQKDSPAYENERLYRDLNIRPLDNFIPVVYQTNSYLGIKSNQWFYLRAVQQIKRLHKQRAIDALISRDPGALPYMAYLQRKHDIAAFYQPHNFYADLKIRPDVNPKNAQKYHLLEKRYVPQMTALLCLQDSQAGWYRKYFPNKDVLASKPGMTGVHDSGADRFEDRLVGYIGSLKLMKGIETILLAMKQLVPKGYKLLLIGGRSPEEIEAIERRMSELHLENSVEIAGWMPFFEIDTHLDRLSVGVIPLQDTFYNRYLTAPNKLFDYLSRGIPIVASNLPSIDDFLSNGREGILFESGDAEDLARSIDHIFSTPGNYSQYRKNAFSTAEEYLWSHRAKKMLDQIESFL